MTLLVLGLRAPVAKAVHGERDLALALVALGPQFVMYLMSFLALGIFWVGQQTQLNFLHRSDRNFTWIHLAFLMAVAIMPFSTKLLARFPHYRTALLVYWMNLVLLGLALYGGWGYAVRRNLLKESMPEEAPAAVCRRILIAQSLYAFGALLCVINTFWSIGFIVLVQLNYAVAPASWRQ